jgi:hypothetical protein
MRRQFPLKRFENAKDLAIEWRKERELDVVSQIEYVTNL